jgi:hypothetical protein
MAGRRYANMLFFSMIADSASWDELLLVPDPKTLIPDP